MLKVTYRTEYLNVTLCRTMTDSMTDYRYI